jgi:hypothetical protein
LTPPSEHNCATKSNESKECGLTSVTSLSVPVPVPVPLSLLPTESVARSKRKEPEKTKSQVERARAVTLVNVTRWDSADEAKERSKCFAKGRFSGIILNVVKSLLTRRKVFMC